MSDVTLGRQLRDELASLLRKKREEAKNSLEEAARDIDAGRGLVKKSAVNNVERVASPFPARAIFEFAKYAGAAPAALIMLQALGAAMDELEMKHPAGRVAGRDAAKRLQAEACGLLGCHVGELLATADATRLEGDGVIGDVGMWGSPSEIPEAPCLSFRSTDGSPTADIVRRYSSVNDALHEGANDYLHVYLANPFVPAEPAIDHYRHEGILLVVSDSLQQFRTSPPKKHRRLVGLAGRHSGAIENRHRSVAVTLVLRANAIAHDEPAFWCEDLPRTIQEISPQRVVLMLSDDLSPADVGAKLASAHAAGLRLEGPTRFVIPLPLDVDQVTTTLVTALGGASISLMEPRLLQLLRQPFWLRLYLILLAERSKRDDVPTLPEVCASAAVTLIVNEFRAATDEELTTIMGQDTRARLSAQMQAYDESLEIDLHESPRLCDALRKLAVGPLFKWRKKTTCCFTSPWLHAFFAGDLLKPVATDLQVASKSTSVRPQALERREAQAQSPSTLSVLVENYGQGQVLSHLAEAEDPLGRDGVSVNVVQAGFYYVLNEVHRLMKGNQPDRTEHSNYDIIICQHHSLAARAIEEGVSAGFDIHSLGRRQILEGSVASRLTCRHNGAWAAVPFQYPTKIIAYRRSAFQHGLPIDSTAFLNELQLRSQSPDFRIAFQGRPGHPASYYEWLAFAHAFGGGDVVWDPVLSTSRIIIESSQTIAGTRLYQQVLQIARDTKSLPEQTDWTTAVDHLAHGAAIGFPFSDTVSSLLGRSDVRHPHDGDDDSADQHGEEFAFAPFRFFTPRELADSGHLSRLLFATRHASAHVFSGHLLLLTRDDKKEAATKFYQWLVSRSTQQALVSRVGEAPFLGTVPQVAWSKSVDGFARAYRDAQQCLVPPPKIHFPIDTSERPDEKGETLNVVQRAVATELDTTLRQESDFAAQLGGLRKKLEKSLCQ